MREAGEGSTGSTLFLLSEVFYDTHLLEYGQSQL